MGPKKNSKSLYIFMAIVVYISLIFLSFHLAAFYAKSPDADIFSALNAATTSLTKNPFGVKVYPQGFKILLIFTFIMGIAAASLWIENERNKQSMPGKENGSAKWNTDYDGYNKKYTSPFGKKDNNGPDNMILSQDVFLSMDGRKTRLNNNVLVIGGSGSGKSRFLVKPNILQANANYIITDPAGELLSSTAGFLEKEKGYKIKVFNLVEMAKSDRYNPFNYIRDNLGVLMMINCLIKNTNPSGKTGGDPFWEKSETALLQALCFYLIKYCPKHQQNFTSVMKLLRAAEIDENDPTKKSKLDRIFDEVAVKDPNSIALKQYLTFKMGAGKTLKSILISCSVRLTVFNMKEIEALTKEDTLDLASFGLSTEPQALYVIIPAADDTYNFLVSMMYSQLFETLYFIAETKYTTQSLPRPVRFLLDEFANIGEIPGFTKKLATMRKYNISCTVILQGLAQLKTMYKDDWETVTSNCDSLVYLGGEEMSTTKEISERLGKSTIVVRNNSRSRGGKGSSSLSFQHSGRELMTPEEIMSMPKDECIVMLNGIKPFYGKKFNYEKHKNYKYTGDADTSLKYVNNKNNTEQKTNLEHDREYENEKQQKYKKSAESKDPNDKILSPPIEPNIVMKDLDIKAKEDLTKFEIEKVPTYEETNEPIERIAKKKERPVPKQKTDRNDTRSAPVHNPQKANLESDIRIGITENSSNNKLDDSDMNGEIFDYTNF